MFYRRLRNFTFFILLLCTLTSCGDESTATKSTQEGQDAYLSNKEMAAILEQIAEETDPRLNYSLNLKLAGILKTELDKATDPQKKFTIKVDYAQQLLFAGKTEAAIKEFEQIAKILGGFNNMLNPKYKPLADLWAVAYLRLGEQQNCVLNHTSASCIVPLQPEAYHQLETGSRNAIDLYAKILEAYPDDDQSKWLINIAYMTLGEYPDKVPAKWRIPVKAFQTENSSLKSFKDVATGLLLDQTGISGGCSIEDFNNDGNLDIFATSYGLKDQAQIWFNLGNGQFKQTTPKSKLLGMVSGLNTIHSDYNNDGFQDILILRGAWMGKGGEHPNSLLRNNGDETFTDVTKAAGLFTKHPTQTAAWADFNLDGWIDLYIGNESGALDQKQKLNHPCELFVNNGDGTFTEVAAKLGLDVKGMIKGVSWGDINNDRMPDLYVSDMVGNNRLFVNRGGTSIDDWKFEEIAAKAGVQEPVFSFPCWFWDFDNDGFEDIYVSSYDIRYIDQVGKAAGIEYLKNQKSGEMPRVYRNNGDETFTDMTEQMRIDKSMYSMGSNFGDIDNDGFLDFYIGTGAPNFMSIVPNRMFRNVGGKYFEEVTMGGFGHLQKGHGISFGDVDNDGDQDIYCVMGGAYEGDVAQNVLFENPNEDNKWINVVLEGKTCGRNALHARIKVATTQENGQEQIFYRAVNTGGTFGASSLQQEIGLAKAVSIDYIEIFWPNPALPIQKFENIQLNSSLKITEGVEAVTYIDRKKMTLTAVSGHQHKHH
jgi:tetratricopeptide (TPR) repeat protein